jgi:ketosteroid isomerase-like protein
MTTNEAGRSNTDTIRLFFARFQRDKSGFLDLWAENPVVNLPFVPPGLPTRYATESEFRGFWDPIFQFRGKFDWTIDELIVSENREVIVALTRSDVDVVTPNGPLRYRGEYIQVFRFAHGKIKEFTEYIDTAKMNEIYGFS